MKEEYRYKYSNLMFDVVCSYAANIVGKKYNFHSLLNLLCIFQDESFVDKLHLVHR